MLGCFVPVAPTRHRRLRNVERLARATVFEYPVYCSIPPRELSFGATCPVQSKLGSLTGGAYRAREPRWRRDMPDPGHETLETPATAFPTPPELGNLAGLELLAQMNSVSDDSRGSAHE